MRRRSRGKKLAGAAKTSFTDKCVKGAVGGWIHTITRTDWMSAVDSMQVITHQVGILFDA
jgi:hypothetical protein